MTIPLCIPNLAGREAEYLQECITTTFVSTVGPFVKRFESMVADAVGSSQAVATASGTCGLQVALVAAGVRPGDLVMAPSFTFIATANAIATCGAQPWLFDVDAASWCLDLDLLEATLARETHRVGGATFHNATGQRVSALMPVCAVGLVPDLVRFRAIADQYLLPLIVDAAAAIGGTRDGQEWGRMADLSVISFNGNKTVTSGGGGAVVGGNEPMLARVRHLSSTARVDADYNHDAVAFNYRMTNICAAVGCAQMEQLSDFVAAKRRIRDTYREALSDIAGIGFYPEAATAENVCWLSGAVLPEAGPSVSAVVAALKAEQIEARAFWKPVHLQAPYLDARRTPMAVTDALWRRVITLPSSTSLTPTDQARVIDVVRKALA